MWFYLKTGIAYKILTFNFFFFKVLKYVMVYTGERFSIWVVFHEHLRITGLQGKGEGISLTPHYHFHPLHRHLVLAGRLLQRAHLCT